MRVACLAALCFLKKSDDVLCFSHCPHSWSYQIDCINRKTSLTVVKLKYWVMYLSTILVPGIAPHAPHRLGDDVWSVVPRSALFVFEAAVLFLLHVCEMDYHCLPFLGPHEPSTISCFLVQCNSVSSLVSWPLPSPYLSPLSCHLKWQADS